MEALMLLQEFNESQAEFWKSVPGYIGYEVSNMGRVRSFKRRTVEGGYLKRGRPVWTITNNPVQIGPYINPKTGYAWVRLYRGDNRSQGFQIHRLVADAFIPNPQNYRVVHHRNCVRHDCRLDNLERTTDSHNQRHAFAFGSKRAKRGGEHAMAKVTEDEVKLIRHLWKSGQYRQTDLAGIFGLERHHVGLIVRRTCWTHI